MASSERLLDVAGRLADGTAVDWASAAQSITDDDDRRLLAELRFIADMARMTRGESSVSPADAWGPLRILEHVGRGTFGDVYRAWDTRLDREVALKILRRRERNDQEQASTVIQEGRLLARVRHPNVATVYGAERINGQVGVWMEFVHGKTLEQELRANGPFDVERVIRIGVELSSALSTVHRAGLIHRDVKAQNVLCDAEGRLVLTDFGAGCDLHEMTAGATRELAGTPISVAPELLAGQPATPQSDVYSLGVLLYHLATETYPVRGSSLKEIREAHVKGRRTPLAAARADLPPAFVRIVDRAIDPNPDNRYESPKTLGSELSSLATPNVDERVAVASSGAGDIARPWWASNRRWWALPIALALVGAVSLWRANGSETSVSLNPEEELTEVVKLTEQGRLEDAYEEARRIRSNAPKSPVAATAVAYALTYAGFLDEAVRAIEDVLAAGPDFIKENGWWTPTALLYQRRLDRFLDTFKTIDTPTSRLYRALAEVERGRRADALQHLVGIESSATSVFKELARALHASLMERQDAAAAIVGSLADQRRAAGDSDGEVTFKQAQILSIAGKAPSALAVLDEAVAQGFVCVACFESSSLLEPVRALPEYARVRERALARQLAFGRRFGLKQSLTTGQ